jgi:hypothetical protein
MRGEITINGVTFVSGCLLYYVATTIPELKVADKVGPAFWPKTVLSLVILLSGFLLIKNLGVLLSKRESPIRPASSDSQKDWTIRLLLTIGLSLLYGFSVSYSGFLLSIFIFQLILLFILKVKKVPILIFFPLIMTGVYYLIFIRVLHMPLPRGTGIFITLSRLFY